MARRGLPSHQTAQEKQHPVHNVLLVLIETLLFEMHLCLPLVNTPPQRGKENITIINAWQIEGPDNSHSNYSHVITVLAHLSIIVIN